MAATHLFIVRIDRQGAAFVATARRVDEEAVGHFVQPQALMDFLVRGPETAPSDEPNSPRADDEPT
jgi:hypothetical protein